MYGDHFISLNRLCIYAVFYAGIIGFSGYWGCERCRTRGIIVKKPTQAEQSKRLTTGSGYGGTGGNDDEVAAVASGGSTVKFPQLDAPLRKDTSWWKYKDKEPSEPSVSIIYAYEPKLKLNRPTPATRLHPIHSQSIMV